MKKEVHPLVLVAAAVVLIGVLGYFGYRTLGVRQVDSLNTMSPELKAKIGAAYGAGGRSRPGTPPAARP